MASIALMIGGAIINATTIVGGSYLAKYLSGSSDSDEEKKRHDLAVEKYQKEYEKYEENRAKLNDWIMIISFKMENKKLSRIYYSPKGFWKGLSAVKKLSQEAGVSEDKAKLWMMKQAIWQIYLPAPKNIPRPTFDVNYPNAVHQADLLFLLHDQLPRGKKILKYALTVVDVACRFKAAEPLTSKDSSEVSKAFRKIYKGPLKWPKILQVDPGREFMGAVKKEMENHGVRIRRGNVNVHRDQGIVERFNRSLSERLFSFQYSQEMNLKSSERSTEWVKRLPEVVSALNREKTRLTEKRQVDAIKKKVVDAKSSTFYSRPARKNEKRLDSSVNVRYLFAPGELEGGGRRATDPNWSLKVFNISRSISNENEPVLYYLKDDPKRGFVREELMIVPKGTELPPGM